MSNKKKWDKRFIKIAHEIAAWSKDDSSQVGAIILDDERSPRSFGYNGMPRGIDDDVPSRHVRPRKYLYMEHAESNTINHCAKVGIPVNGCTIYVTHFPCAGCSRKIINSGIKRVVVDGESLTTEFKDRWEEEIEVAVEMFDEVGIDLTIIDMDEEDDT